MTLRRQCFTFVHGRTQVCSYAACCLPCYKQTGSVIVWETKDRACRLQKTLIGPTYDNPYRIDLQTNGAFPQSYVGSDGIPVTVLCYQVAVQMGN